MIDRERETTMTDLFDPKTPTGQMLRGLWADIQRSQQECAIAAAKAAPKAHKLSRLIAGGKPASYHYYAQKVKAVNGRARRRVFWCYTDHPNIAGYYLSFRQVETKRIIKRTQYKAHKHQYLAEARCQKESDKAAAAIAPPPQHDSHCWRRKYWQRTGR